MAQETFAQKLNNAKKTLWRDISPDGNRSILKAIKTEVNYFL